MAGELGTGPWRLCPRCEGEGEVVVRVPSIVDDPADVVRESCSRCQGEGQIRR